MVTTNSLVGSLLKILNDNSKLTDARPSTQRIGSFFFGPNQEIVFRNSSPKGKVTVGENFSDTHSFGRVFERNKHYNIHIGFFVPQKYKDPNTGLQDFEMINDYFEKIETSIITYGSMLGPVVLEEMRMEDEPFYLPDQQVYGGVGLFVFTTRK